MRIILMHNPTAGRGKHDKRELMAALANAGHHAKAFFGLKSSGNQFIEMLTPQPED
jgi:hypothetical protein